MSVAQGDRSPESGSPPRLLEGPIEPSCSRAASSRGARRAICGATIGLSVGAAARENGTRPVTDSFPEVLRNIVGGAAVQGRQRAAGANCRQEGILSTRL